MKQVISILPNEFWWGGAVCDGACFPLSTHSEYKRDFTVNQTYNQLSGTFVSTCGRYVFLSGEYALETSNGVMVFSCSSDIVCEEGFGDLKGAVTAVAKRYSIEPIMDRKAVTSPQYCTWMEMLKNPTQDKVLTYAQSILDAGMPAGTLIIDDGWMRTFGDWRFNDAFENPKETVNRLHELGFTVVLWLVPFVDVSAVSLWRENAFVHDGSGKLAVRAWWNGASYVLDMSSESAKVELQRQLQNLTDMGIDGFKFDGGDAMYYRVDDKTAESVTPNEQSRLWAEFALDYRYAELRACVGLQGRRLVQRLCDKGIAWCGGLDALIPDMIQAGLSGYPYICPDMIGGGQSDDRQKATDEDWYIRSVQCACLSPMWQFSRAIWNVSPRVKTAVLDCVNLREKVMPHILRVTELAALHGEPILRPMCYNFAGQGLEKITDQFMIGESVLVAPIVTPRSFARRVVLPAGTNWKSLSDAKVYYGGQTVTVGDLPCFMRIE